MKNWAMASCAAVCFLVGITVGMWMATEADTQLIHDVENSAKTFQGLYDRQRGYTIKAIATAEESNRTTRRCLAALQDSTQHLTALNNQFDQLLKQ